jgi:hypothetical protein
MHRCSWLLVAVAWIIATGGLTGCGSNGPDCGSVADPCDRLEDRECDTDLGGVRECRRDAVGCLAWATAVTCGPHQVCDGSGELVECVCDTVDCAVDDAFCRDDAIFECVADDDGCRVPEVRENCSLTGRFCEEDEGVPGCTGCLEDLCETEGELRCSDDLDAIEACSLQDTGCLDWAVFDTCAATYVCSTSEGEAACVPGCESTCPAEGDTRCSDVGSLETCTVHDDECLYWGETDPCDGEREHCDDSVAPAACVTCSDECETLDEARCVERSIEVCAAAETGCLGWVEVTRCADLEPAQDCYTVEDTPMCLEHPPGDSCTAPLVVVPPFVASGDDFLRDRSDTMVLSGEGCTTRVGSVEAVFAVDLAAGQTVLVREVAGLDVVLSVQAGACGGDVACAFSSDGGEVAGHRYTAEVDGRVFVVVEAYLPTPFTRDFEVHIDLVAAETCDDGVDNDFDDAIDCDDSDCFGREPCDAAETNCSDGADNDGDSDIDCDDSDCTDQVVCLPARGVFEMFGGTDDAPDLAGHSLFFTPDAGEPDGFTWRAEPGLEVFPHDPGSGAVTVTLDLGDNDWDEHVFTRLPGFPFFGTTWSSVFVGANGYVTFDVGSTSASVSERAFFAHPSVAGIRADLDPGRPSRAGDPSITVDEWDDRAVITYERVPVFSMSGEPPGPNDFQVVLDADGSIEIHVLSLAAVTCAVGVSAGPGDGTYPPEIDFVP